MIKSLLTKITAGALCATAGIAGLTGCGQKAGDNTEEKGRNSVTAFVGTTIFSSSLDPIKGAMAYGYPFINNALLTVNTKSEYVGDLATDWKISDDALTYTFNLKKGVKFSDGSDFNADDVVFTYETVQKNQAKNSKVDLSKLESVKKKDDYTVEFKLKQPYSTFVDLTAMQQIVPSDAYDSEKFDTKPIGTGAYKVADYVPNQQIILEANKNSHVGTPKINKVTLVYMDQDAAMAAAKSGKLDVVMVAANYTKENVPGMKISNQETMDVRNISLPVIKPQTIKNSKGEEFNVGNNVTSDKAVRKALSIGINRKQIIDQAFLGVGVPAIHFTNNLIWASTDTYKDNQVEEAKKILDEAGWKLASDGIREKDGNKCEFDVYAPGKDEERYNLATAMAANAKDLGIKVNVKTASWDEVGKYSSAAGVVWGWGQFNPNAIDNLFNSKKFIEEAYANVVGYNNPEVDKIIEAAYNSRTQKEAIENWKKAQSLADADYPYLYLVNIRHCYFVNEKLDVSEKTQIPHPHGHGSPIICNIKDWTWK